MKMTWEWTGEEATMDDIKNQVGDGWRKLVEELVIDLEKLGWNGIVAQVKEKFGGLRFYIGDGNTAIFNRIDKAERESFKICELCGKPGEVRMLSWIKTMCNECCGNQEEEYKKYMAKWQKKDQKEVTEFVENLNKK